MAGESRGRIDKREDRRGKIMKIIKKFVSKYKFSLVGKFSLVRGEGR